MVSFRILRCFTRKVTLSHFPLAHAFCREMSTITPGACQNDNSEHTQKLPVANFELLIALKNRRTLRSRPSFDQEGAQNKLSILKYFNDIIFLLGPLMSSVTIHALTLTNQTLRWCLSQLSFRKPSVSFTGKELSFLN